ncbi:MAG: hypothetical protein V7765_19955 [Oleispira sp.]|jgi:hypothetical protein
MEIKLEEEYENLATEWQYQMILLLKEKLKKNGVSDESAKEIIGEFTFDLSMLHDQGEIKVDGKSFNPRICFDDFSGNLIGTDEETNLHEYAFGSTSEAFGE